MPSTDDIYAQLALVEDPEIHRPITELGMVKSVSVSGHCADIAIYLTIKSCPMQDTIRTRVVSKVLEIPGIDEVNVSLDVMSDAQREALKVQLRGPEPEIVFNRPNSRTRIFAIASGKGGVGKSSLTANLAAIMSARGLNVGIIDADIYGHSIPRIMGLKANETVIDPDLRIPPSAGGVKVLSVSSMKGPDSNKPIAMRGPMLGKFLTQFLTDFFWGDLDILLLDLPPGTGDIAISLGQLLPKAHIVVVTTPQIAASEVAIRAGMMATLINQNVVGVIENMSWSACEHCNEKTKLFGEGGGALVASELTRELGYEVNLLGQIPFMSDVVSAGDAGRTIPTFEEQHPVRIEMELIATELLRKTSLQKQSLLGAL